MNNGSVLKLLAQSSFVMYNKHIAKALGIETAVLLGFLCDYQQSFGNNEFFKELDKISADTGLTQYAIKQATKNLVNASILKVVKKGMPAKNYYYISEEGLFNFLSTKLSSGCEFGRTSGASVVVGANSVGQVNTNSVGQVGANSYPQTQNTDTNNTDTNTSPNTSNNTYLSDISNNTAITDCQKADNGNNKGANIDTEHHIGQTEQKEEVKKEKGANNTEMKVSFVKGLVAKKEPRTKEEIMIAHLQKSLDNLDKGKELKDALKNWVAILVKNKGGIQTEQIKLALEELESITKDETKQLEIVKEASQLGYLKFKWVKLETPKGSKMCNPENELPSFEEIEARDRKRFEDDIKSGKYKEPEKKFDEQGRRYF